MSRYISAQLVLLLLFYKVTTTPGEPRKPSPPPLWLILAKNFICKACDNIPYSDPLGINFPNETTCPTRDGYNVTGMTFDNLATEVKERNWLKAVKAMICDAYGLNRICDPPKDENEIECTSKKCKEANRKAFNIPIRRCSLCRSENGTLKENCNTNDTCFPAWMLPYKVKLGTTICRLLAAVAVVVVQFPLLFILR